MKFLVYSFSLCLLISCSNKQTDWDPTKGSEFLNGFYEHFYETEDNLQFNEMDEYLSNDFYNTLNGFNETNNSGEEVILDFDPFTVAQDFDPESIKKTLKIEPLEEKNQFEVSLIPFDGASPSIIQYQLKENGNGKLVISNILNNDLFIIGFENK